MERLVPSQPDRPPQRPWTPSSRNGAEQQHPTAEVDSVGADVHRTNVSEALSAPQSETTPSRPQSSPQNTPIQTDKASPQTPATQQPDTGGKTLSPEEQAKLMIEADQLYQSGQRLEAEALYRQAKQPLPDSSGVKPPAEPIQDPAQLPPGGRVYWREAKAGLDLNLKTRIFVPLKLLVKEYPEFIPGHLRLAEALVADQKTDEALVVMGRAASLYPNQPSLQKGLIKQQVQSKKWMEASITARQFALLNPEHPDAPEFSRLSEDYQDRFRARLRTQITNNTIGSFITGALGIAITGSPLPGLSALQTSILLLRGETAVGNAIADRAKRQLPLIKEPKVQAYVDGIGQKLTALAGREFNYQFFIVSNDQLNAFALPGGKIFINGGAILKSKSEAELAGLIAHELSHAVLSHGFQIATESSEAGGLTRLIPYVGGVLTNLVVADYSREMERQADILGTRLLTSANYAADGLRNLMVTLSQEKKPFVAPWFSSHPGSLERVRYLEQLIIENGYNRYAYEGIEEHQQIQALVKAELKKAKDKEGQSETSSDPSESDANSDSDTPNDSGSDTKSQTPSTSSPEPAPSPERTKSSADQDAPNSSPGVPKTTDLNKTPPIDPPDPAQ
ncbi:M48 family metalloprotease [Acaryochloris sp. IP29b_bin.148]|uniref:M48 family metalloprotease n=1 Tax=Acaryochloris sp. IP29b_bin.148 TaxID=2969218 RepID=UPI0026370DDE|nr:M48 family metalloprotease [Acaryochloris sp. IP29b_bin.148]